MTREYILQTITAHMRLQRIAWPLSSRAGWLKHVARDGRENHRRRATSIFKHRYVNGLSRRCRSGWSRRIVQHNDISFAPRVAFKTGALFLRGALTALCVVLSSGALYGGDAQNQRIISTAHLDHKMGGDVRRSEL
jgi:hypothetical protein